MEPSHTKKGMQHDVDPVKICQQLYGKQNVIDVRDCIMDSIYRFYGSMCEFHKNNISKLIQTYLIKVLTDAQRNPNAVKLAVSPSHLHPNFFVQRYIETNFDKEKAYELCVSDCSYLRPGMKDECKTNCHIDKHSV
jgi:hypothetical protein